MRKAVTARKTMLRIEIVWSDHYLAEVVKEVRRVHRSQRMRVKYFI